MIDDGEVVDALVEECDAIIGALDDVDAGAFAGATNCPPWTLKELVVHLWGTLLLPPSWNPSDGRPIAVADYYRRAERETEEYRTRNVENARRAAARRFPTAADAVQAFGAAARGLGRRADPADLGLVVMIGERGPIRVVDYLRTRLVSVAIHGIDVAISVKAEPFTTPRAAETAVDVLEDLLGMRRADLGWDAVDMIGWTTGRVQAPEVELQRLGDRAASLPLIS